MKKQAYLFYSYLIFFSLTPILLVIILLNPDRLVASGYSFVPRCLTVVFFDIECPGCGMGRSLCLVAHGRLAEAAQFNVSGVYLFVLLISVDLVAIAYCVREMRSLYINRAKTTC
jgi:hypothetical protein